MAMWRNRNLNFLMALPGLINSVSLAGEPRLEKTTGKSDSHLWNPTPTKLLRELSTDLPDKTEPTRAAEDFNPFAGITIRL